MADAGIFHLDQIFILAYFIVKDSLHNKIGFWLRNDKGSCFDILQKDVAI